MGICGSEESNNQAYARAKLLKTACTADKHALPTETFSCMNEYCNVKPIVCPVCCHTSEKNSSIKLCSLCRLTEKSQHIMINDEDLEQSGEQVESVQCIASVSYDKNKN